MTNFPPLHWPLTDSLYSAVPDLSEGGVETDEPRHDTVGSLPQLQPCSFGTDPCTSSRTGLPPEVPLAAALAHHVSRAPAYAHGLSFSLNHSITRSPSLSLSYSLLLSLTLSYFHKLSLFSLLLTHSLSLALSYSLSPILSYLLSLLLSLWSLPLKRRQTHPLSRTL